MSNFWEDEASPSIIDGDASCRSARSLVTPELVLWELSLYLVVMGELSQDPRMGPQPTLVLFCLLWQCTFAIEKTMANEGVVSLVRKASSSTVW